MVKLSANISSDELIGKIDSSILSLNKSEDTLRGEITGGVTCGWEGSSLPELSDVNSSLSPTSGDYFIYSGTEWVAHSFCVIRVDSLPETAEESEIVYLNTNDHIYLNQKGG